MIPLPTKNASAISCNDMQPSERISGAIFSFVSQYNREHEVVIENGTPHWNGRPIAPDHHEVGLFMVLLKMYLTLEPEQLKQCVDIDYYNGKWSISIMDNRDDSYCFVIPTDSDELQIEHDNFTRVIHYTDNAIALLKRLSGLLRLALPNRQISGVFDEIKFTY